MMFRYYTYTDERITSVEELHKAVSLKQKLQQSTSPLLTTSGYGIFLETGLEEKQSHDNTARNS